MVPDVTVFVPGNVTAGALEHDDLLHAGGVWVGQRFVDIGLERRALAAPNTFVGGNDHLGFAVDDATGQRLRREAAKHHRVNRTDTGTGQHGHHRFGHHRHVDRHHVATVHVLTAQGVRQLAHFFVQFTVGNVALLGRVIALPDNRHLIAALGQMTVQAVIGHVEGAVGKPFDVDMVIVERGLLDRGERLDPVETLGLLAPETIRVDDRLLVHRLVGRLIGQRVGCDLGAYGIQGSCTHVPHLNFFVVVVL